MGNDLGRVTGRYEKINKNLDTENLEKTKEEDISSRKINNLTEASLLERILHEMRRRIANKSK